MQRSTATTFAFALLTMAALPACDDTACNDYTGESDTGESDVDLAPGTYILDINGQVVGRMAFDLDFADDQDVFKGGPDYMYLDTANGFMFSLSVSGEANGMRVFADDEPVLWSDGDCGGSSYVSAHNGATLASECQSDGLPFPWTARYLLEQPHGQGLDGMFWELDSSNLGMGLIDAQSVTVGSECIPGEMPTDCVLSVVAHPMAKYYAGPFSAVQL